MPPVIPPIFELASSWAARRASLTAACTISASSSASSGSIASGSIDDLLQGQVAAHLDLDHAAAGAGLDDLVFERLLSLQHLGLHLLRLFHQGVDVEAPGHSTFSHLTDLLRVELALQLLDQRLVVDALVLAGAGLRGLALEQDVDGPQPGRRSPPPAHSPICSRLSGASALRLLKVTSAGNPIVNEPSSSIPTGRAPSKVAASAGAVGPQVLEDGGPDVGELVQSRVEISARRRGVGAGPDAASGGPAGGGSAPVSTPRVHATHGRIRFS